MKKKRRYRERRKDRKSSNTPKKYNADTERDGESSLARLRAPLQAERKIYGYQHC